MTVIQNNETKKIEALISDEYAEKNSKIIPPPRIVF